MSKEYLCPICGCSRGYICCDVKEPCGRNKIRAVRKDVPRWVRNSLYVSRQTNTVINE